MTNVERYESLLDKLEEETLTTKEVEESTLNAAQKESLLYGLAMRALSGKLPPSS